MQDIHPRKLMRTGDCVVQRSTGKIGHLQYMYEKSGQMSFESRMIDLSTVQFFDGNNLLKIPASDLALTDKE